MLTQSLVYICLLGLCAGKYIQYDVHVKTEAKHRGSFPVRKREGQNQETETSQVPLVVDSKYYGVHLEIGSNNQTILALLDTGSSDLVVQSIDNINCGGVLGFLDKLPTPEWLGSSAPPSEAHDPGNKTKNNYNANVFNAISKAKNTKKPFLPAKFAGIEDLLTEEQIHRNDWHQQLDLASNYFGMNCSQSGRFDYFRSETFENLTTPAYISYTGWDNSGYFARDTVKLGPIELEDFQFALIDKTTFYAGSVLGLGPTSLEAGATYGLPQYPNLVETLKRRGEIQSRILSVDLGSGHPSVIFGGVDMAKARSGNLTILPMVEPIAIGAYETVAQYNAVELNSFGFEKGNPDLYGSVFALIDTGTQVSVLTPEMYQSVLGRFEFEAISYYQYIIHQDQIDDEQTLYFNFDGYELDVPLKRLLTPVNFLNGTSSGYLMLTDVNSGTIVQDYVVIGTDILEMLYLVFDYENLTIGMGKQSQEPGSEVVELLPNSTYGARSTGSEYHRDDFGFQWNTGGDNEFSAWRWFLEQITPKY